MKGVFQLISISLCMIVKNEEEVLARCLESVKDIVDEINIVDTGSTDRTVEIASSFTDNVYHYEWTGNFAQARNVAHAYATKEYTLYLDADDVILPKDKEKFLQLKETLDPNVDAVSMYYHAGTDEFGNVTIQYRLNRLLKTAKKFQWQGDCHNYLNVTGHIINSDIAITHKKISHSVGRNLSIYEERKKRNEDFSARDYFYYGNELRENKYYEEAIKSYQQNLEMHSGWIEDKVYAATYQADCYRILKNEKQELNSLFYALQLAKLPRPEICSRLGYHFQQKRDFKPAVYWYELATTIKTDPNKWSFTYPAYATWYPHLQLCVCYYNLQQFEKAYEHNEKARIYRPEDQRVLFNKELLEKRLDLSNEK